MNATATVVRAGVRRRRARTLVIGLATAAAVAASVLGGSLLVASDAPFDRAFAGQHGAHLTAQFDAARTTADRAAASARAAGATAWAGPFRTVVVDPQDAGTTGDDLAGPPPMTVTGRADPGGPVDDLTLVGGVWATGPGQIVLSADYAGPARLGTVLHVPDLPGDPRLTVVGIARSVGRSSDAWVAPSQIAALTRPGDAGGYRMLYRFARAGTAAQVAADRAAVAAATPGGALTGAQSWLDVRQGSDRNTALFVPFLVAFGLLGVLMSLLVAGTTVAGAVGAGTRRTGALKAIGFTPAQVVRVYAGQALIPAAVGAAVGAAAGDALAVPVLATTGQVYDAPVAGVLPWVDTVVAAAVLALVAATAWTAAARAGRLRTVDALAVGRAPATGRGRAAVRLAGRLPLPLPVRLGLARPFARPARAAGMLAAIAFGTAAVTFATGMAGSMDWVQRAKQHDPASAVVRTVAPPAPGTAGPAVRSTADPAAVRRAVTAQGGTLSWYDTADTEATVPGVAGSTTVRTFDGDATRAGYRMAAGRWFRGPGEAVAPSTFLTAAGVRLGDTVTLELHGRAVRVRIVGEVFDPHTRTNEVLTDARSAAGAAPAPDEYLLRVRSGTDVHAYLTGLNRALAPLGLTAVRPDGGGTSDVIVALDSLTAALSLLLVAVAGLGVLNTVLLDTRERVRDIGVARALGMTPRQTLAMVLSSVVPVGAAGAAVGLLAGAVLHAVTVPAMGRSAGLDFPAAAVDVLSAPALALLAAGGVLIAVLGALPPAGWAARARTGQVLRTE